MAIGIQNYPNITSTSAAYPDGDIKDAPSGTPVNKFVYSDMNQHFAKLIRRSRNNPTTEDPTFPNGLPDNNTNGYQYVEALKRQLSKYSEIIRVPDSLVAINLGAYNPQKRYLIVVTGVNTGKIITLLGNALSLPYVEDAWVVTIVNKSTQSVQIAPGVNSAINGGGAINLSAGGGITLILDKPAPNNYITVKSF